TTHGNYLDVGGVDGCGSWYYTNSYNGGNLVKTAAAVAEYHFLGTPSTDPNVQGGIGFMWNAWNASSGWADGIGNSYTMYGIMKSMRLWNPNILAITDYA